MNDYVLVKDENGQLKYYKDGQFFDLEEIEAQKKQGETRVTPPVAPLKKISLAPPLTTLPKPPAPIAPPISQPAKEVLQTPPPVEKKILEEKKESTAPATVYDVEAQVEAIIKELKVSFTDKQIEQQFRRVILARLENLRDDKETLYRLMVPKDEGGLGLTDRHAAVVLAVVKKHLPKSAPPIKSLPPATSPKVLSSAKPVVTQTVKPVKAAPEKIAGADGRLMPQQTAPIIPLPEDLGRVVAPRPVTRKVTVKPIAASMSDISYRPQLVGPIDELRMLDLISFRRLGNTPAEIIDEIQEKIALLKQESYIKGVEGVRAWQASEVYKIYTEIGVQSIVSGKPIDEVVVERQIKNLPVITQSEFEAIIELNNKLGI